MYHRRNLFKFFPLKNEFHDLTCIVAGGKFCIGSAFGTCYYFSKHFCLGGELQFNYTNIGQWETEGEEERNDISKTSLRSITLLFVRWFF